MLYFTIKNLKISTTVTDKRNELGYGPCENTYIRSQICFTDLGMPCLVWGGVQAKIMLEVVERISQKSFILSRGFLPVQCTMKTIDKVRGKNPNLVFDICNEIINKTSEDQIYSCEDQKTKTKTSWDLFLQIDKESVEAWFWLPYCLLGFVKTYQHPLWDYRFVSVALKLWELM